MPAQWRDNLLEMGAVHVALILQVMQFDGVVAGTVDLLMRRVAVATPPKYQRLAEF